MVFFLVTFFVVLFFLWSSNPIHSVLTLVLLGLTFAAQLLIEGLEFPALIVVLVYVGAVNVLFIFVVMMVNLRSTPYSFASLEVYLLWVFLTVLLLTTNRFPLTELTPFLFQAFPVVEHTTSLTSLGVQLYTTDRLWMVVVVSLVLLLSMVAAICLSLVTSENYRTQEFYSQISNSNAVFTLSTSKPNPRLQKND